ncbi:unnamed protein product, partial [Polarella glacialis]
VHADQVKDFVRDHGKQLEGFAALVCFRRLGKLRDTLDGTPHVELVRLVTLAAESKFGPRDLSNAMLTGAHLSTAKHSNLQPLLKTCAASLVRQAELAAVQDFVNGLWSLAKAGSNNNNKNSSNHNNSNNNSSNNSNNNSNNNNSNINNNTNSNVNNNNTNSNNTNNINNNTNNNNLNYNINSNNTGPEPALLELAVQLSERAAAGIQDFCLLDLQKVTWAWATLALQDNRCSLQFIPAGLAALQARVTELCPRGLADFAWSIARLQPSTDLLPSIADQASVKLHNFADNDISRLSWAFAKVIGCKGGDGAANNNNCNNYYNKNTNDNNNNNNSNNINNINNNNNDNNDISRYFFNLLALEVMRRRMSGFSPQNLANLSWAFATVLADGHPPLFEGIAAAAAVRLRRAESSGSFTNNNNSNNKNHNSNNNNNFKPQELSNLAWALAALHQKAGGSPSLLWSAVGEVVFCRGKANNDDNDDDDDNNNKDNNNSKNHKKKGGLEWARQFRPQELSSLTWALAKCLLASPTTTATTTTTTATTATTTRTTTTAPPPESERRGEIFKLLVEAAELQLRAFEPQHLAQLAWAVAALASKEQQVLRTTQYASTMAIQRVAEFKPQELANLVWAWAILRMPEAEKHFESIGPVLAERMREVSPQGLSSIAWSMGALQTCPEEVWAALSGQAMLQLTEFKPQELSNISWALARALQHRAAPLLSAVTRQSRALLANNNSKNSNNSNSNNNNKNNNKFSPQNLSNLCWSMAITSVGDPELMEEVAQGTFICLAEFKTQEISNLLWSYASLQESSHGPLFEVLGSTFMGKLEDFDASSDAQQVPELRVSLATDILGVVWAYNFLQLDHAVLSPAHHTLLRIGRSLDGKKVNSAGLRPLGVGAPGFGQSDLEPRVVLELPDRLVLMKPPGWEVERSARGGGAAHVQDDADGGQPPPMQLVTFLQAQEASASCRWEILRDSRFHWGFLHRLDVPSSGLVLAAKTYEAFYDLALQLNTGRLVRDYLILCHGWVPQDCSEISARVHWRRHDSSPSQVLPCGKPSRTALQVVAHFHRRSSAPVCNSNNHNSNHSNNNNNSSAPDSGSVQRFSLLKVRIATGRRHQIRVHMAHIGHPVVCDGKYTARTTFHDDLQWCPRNFLHRHRLEFHDLRGVLQVATEELPTDLAAALGGLEPVE